MKKILIIVLFGLILFVYGCFLTENKAYENFVKCKENSTNIYNCINIYNYEYMNL